ncbi:flagellar hook-associated protein FlgL [Maridesulfovibrio ferrireducens]|uniref:flagellar hook-associated protein FlgL n=1 Tax=Maridesulfovibrio ferrireducens TaxID=246191 RepID=UPI001A327B83|nr:flagellar hook-associated protein FlgL [Maridesulfovibrio ferrireducens]MBI9112203.1 flagellar hook-associated protein FlgL [Maridesulfovibrio ferrireducens]
MRVTQQMLFGTYVSNMNRSLTDLVESNIQAQTQKKINKPSDNPVGMARILDHRETLATVKQYRNNIDTAKGWLSLSDTTLNQSSTIITRAKEIAEQAASGTITADNREQLSYEARQLFQQLVSLANTEYEGKSIYAGHKVDQNAFKETLWMTTNDSNVSSQQFSIEGNTDKTIVVQFLDSGNIGAADLDYRYSKDGGKTFTTKTLTTGTNTLDFDGVTMSLETGTTVRANPLANTNDSTGTWMWVRPTAQYMGDDEDAVNIVGMNTTLAGGRTKAEGVFTNDVVVRIDSAAQLQSNISYSYSIDGGINWVEGNVKSADGIASNAVLSIPGGILTIYSNAGAGGTNQLQSNSQFIVRPDTAAINFQIQENEYVRVNDVGKDLFGGVYQAPGESAASTVFNDDSMLTGSNASSTQNLLETMGNLVAFLETNNQSGVQECLASLDKSQQYLLTKLADVGGRENRLAVADNVLSSLELNEKERISHIEDIDVGELMTQLSQQQIVYEAVLKSSSMIMKMNLLNYI